MDVVGRRGLKRNMVTEEEAAKQAITDAKSMIGRCKYKDAKSKIEEAINLFPAIKYGKEMITVCEIRFLCTMNYRYARGREIWPYTLLQIPISSTESEVKSRYVTLRAHLVTIRKEISNQIRGTADAIRELDLAMSIYMETNSVDNRKRKADEEKAASCDGGGGGDGGDDDKLRKQIFTALPQQPHFSPLAEYCPSFRQEMKLGFDKIFVKLTQRLQNLVGDQILSQEDEDTIEGELSNLEKMGYDVMKLRERFDLLVRVKTIAEEDEKYEEKRKKLDYEISAEMVQLALVQCRISNLKCEKQLVEARHSGFKSEMASLKSKLSKGDLYSMVKMEEVEDK